MFGRRERTLRRVLIVEDEPLVAFDSEHLLRDAGFEVIGTVDNVADASRRIGEGGIDLVLADVNLSGDGNGTDVARAAHGHGIVVLLVTGDCPPEAEAFAVGCLAKPYSQRGLLAAIEAIETKLAGKPPRRLPAGLRLFGG